MSVRRFLPARPWRIVSAAAAAIGAALLLTGIEPDAAPVAQVSPTHRWALDETTGTTAFDNPVGVAVANGTLQAGATHTTRSTCAGNSGVVNLTGATNSYINLGVAPGQVGTSNFTAAFSFKTSQAGAAELFSNRVDGSHGKFLSIRLSAGKVVVEVDQDTGGTNYAAIVSPATYNDNAWHHVAARRTGSAIALYVDGTLVGSATGAGTASISNSNALLVGASPYSVAGGLTPFFVGQVDDVEMYASALSLREVEALASKFTDADGNGRCDRLRAYITNQTESTVTVVDLNTNLTIATIPVSYAPSQIALSATRGYTAGLYNDEVSVIDLASNTVVDTLTGFNEPNGVAVVGNLLYVANVSYVSVTDLTTKAIIATIPTLNSPDRLFVWGTRLFAIEQSDPGASVAVINLLNNTRIAPNISFANPPYDLTRAIVSEGQGYLSSINTGAPSALQLFNPLTNANSGTVPGVDYTDDIVATPNTLYALQQPAPGTPNITAINRTTLAQSHLDIDIVFGNALGLFQNRLYVPDQGGGGRLKVISIDSSMSLLSNTTIGGSPYEMAIGVQPLNNPPVANAGPDRIVLVTPTFCEALMTPLDGSLSTDPEGQALTYTWKEGATTLGTTSDPDNPVLADLALGAHTLTLTVTDAAGATSAPDTVVITVKDTVAPVLYADDVTLAQTSAGGAVFNPATYPVTVDDQCNPSLTATVTSTVPPGNLFPLGVTNVEYSATDSSGNTGVYTIQVTVLRAVTVPATATAYATQPATLNLSLFSAVPSSVTVTPSAPGVVFSPPSVTFSGATLSASLTATAATAGSYAITYVLTGASASLYAPPAMTSLTVTPQKTITPPALPAVTIGATTGALTMTLGAAPDAGTSLTLTPAAITGVTYNPTSLAFTSAQTTKTFTIATGVTATAGTKTLGWTLSGTAAGQYATPSAGTLTLTSTIATPTYPSLYVNETSGALTFTVVAKPAAGTTLVLTPSSTGVTFSPLSVTFTNAGSASQTLTATPTTSGSKTITYALTGTASAFYATPAQSTLTANALKTVTVPTYPSLYVNQTSAAQTFTVSAAPDPGTTLTITPSASNVTFSPASLTFTNAGATSQTLTATASTAGTKTIAYTLSGTAAFSYVTPGNGSLPVAALKTITTPTYPATYVNLASPPVTFTVSARPDAGTTMTITPSATGVTFSPASLTFTSAGATSQTLTATGTTVGPKTISYVLTDAGAVQYAPPAPSAMTVNALKTIATPTYPGLYVGDTSAAQTFTLSATPDAGTSLTVTPSATGVTFTPASLSFTFAAPTSQTVTVTSGTLGIKTIAYALGGTASFQYTTPASGSLTVNPPKTITAPTYPSLYLNQTSAAQTFTLSAAPDAGTTVIVTPAATGVTFAPTSLTFTSASATSQTLTATPAASGTWPVSYVLTGTGAAFQYATPAAGTLTVNALKTVAVPPSYPPLYVSQTSAAQTIQISASPDPGTSLIVTPTAPGVTFSPASLTFANPGTTSQTLTATPSTAGPKIITYLLSGTGTYAFAAAPPSTLTVNALKTVTVPASYPALYVNQTSGAQTFQVSATPDIGTSLTITPTAPGVTFFPTSLIFSSSDPTSQTLTVTSTAAGTQTVAYALSGTAAFSYVVPASGTLTTTALKSVSPPASFSVPIGGTSATLTMTLSAAPDAGTSLTVTPGAPLGVTFSPASVLFTVGQTSATFTATALSQNVTGTQPVTWANSGSAALQYSTAAGSTASLTSTASAPSTASSYATQPSSALSVTLAKASPGGTLTITPSSTGVTFAPPSLTFNPGDTFQSMTATSATTGTKTITYALSGTAAAFYTAPASTTLTVSALKTFTVPTYPSLYVNQTSGTQTFQVSATPDAGTSVTITPSAPGVTFSPSSLTFLDTGPTSQTLTVTSSTAGTKTVAYALSGPAAFSYTTPASGTLTVTAQKTIAPPALSALPIGSTSSTLTMTLGATPDSGTSLTLTPGAIPGVTFTPATLSFTSAQTTATFTIAAAASATAGNKSVTWTPSGTATAQYAAPAASTLPLTSTIATPAYPATYVGQTSAPLTFTVGASPDAGTSVILTPSSTGVTFSPASLTFTNGGSTSQTLTVTPTTAGAKTITYALTGTASGFYATPASGSMTANALKTITAPTYSSVYVNETSGSQAFTVSAAPDAGTSLTITPSATGVTFSPTTLTFTNGGPTAQGLTVSSAIAGTKTISYALSGTAAFSYTTPGAGSLLVKGLKTVAAPAYPDLSVNQTSGALTFTVSAAPDAGTSLTVTPTSAGVTFSPSSLTFTSAGATSQTLTVSSGIAGAKTVTYALSDTAAFSYTTPASGSFTVNAQKTIGPPLPLPALPIGSTTATLTMTLSAAPNAGTDLTVTPSSIPGVTFTPASLTFTSAQTTATFTITAAASAFAGSNTVTWTPSGTALPQYAAPALSTLALTSTVAPPAYPTLSVNQTSGALTVTVGRPPDVGTSLTITPSAADVTFSPASLTFTNGGPTSQTLTATAGTSGTKTIDYALSGTAAPFYATPASGTLTVSTAVTVGTSTSGRSFTVDGTAYTSSQTFEWLVGSAHTIDTTGTQSGGSGTQYVFSGWSDDGALSHGVVAPAAAVSYTASFDTQYQLTTAASPAAGGSVTPASGSYYNAGTVVTVGATPNAGYQFGSWTGAVANPASASTTVTMSGPQSVVANFDQLASVTVTTAPGGRSFTVDGTPYASSQTFSWIVGSAHTIATSSPQAGGAGTQYAFASWSDGGALSHSVTAPASATTYTASFTTQYQLTTASSPGAGGTATPAAGAYYDAGSVVSLNATPNAGYQFASWTGAVANPSNAATTVTMSGPQSVTANFDQLASVTVTTSPAGRSFTVDGTPYAASQTFSWIVGSAHTIETSGPQAGGAGTQYAFASWSDAGAMSHSVTAPASAMTYTASFTTQYQLTTAATPGAGGTATPASGSYYDAGTVVSLNATPNASYQFASWSGAVANPSNAATSVTMSGPQSVTANFDQLASVTVTTAPAGRSFSVDGTPYASSQTFSWIVGSAHTIATSGPQAGGAGTQYAFASWSDAGAMSHSVTAPASAATFTANFTTQYQLTTAATPGAGGTATPASGAYYDAGTVVSLGASANAGYQFASWSGAVANPSSAATTVTMSGPQSVIANFDQLASVTVIASPAGRSFSVDGTTYTATQTFTWVAGSAHSIATTDPQAGGGGTQYTFSNWSDGGALSHAVTGPATATTYIASFATILPATDISGSVSITRGGFKLVQATGRFTQAVTLKNTGATAVSAVSLVLDNLLASTTTLFGAAEGNSCPLAGASPHTAVNVGTDGLLTPGEQVTMTLEFINPSRAGITYGTRVLAGAGCH